MSSSDNSVTLSFRISLAWWLKPYLYAVIILAHLHNRMLCEESLAAMIQRGVKVREIRK
jgi:hypothetical protein